MSQSSTVEKMAIGQNMLQFVLLGVPFSTLAQCCSPATGIVSRIDSSKLKTYYLGEIEKAKANRDSKSETILRSQLEALESKILKNAFLRNLRRCSSRQMTLLIQHMHKKP